MKNERFAIMLIVAVMVLIVDYNSSHDFFSSFANNRFSNKCMRLYAGKNEQLLFIQCTKREEGTKNNIPVNLAPFFFKPLNINTASKDILMTVKGIGPTLGEAIVEHRRLYGPFVTVDDMLALKGIGPKRADYFSTLLQFGEDR